MFTSRPIAIEKIAYYDVDEQGYRIVVPVPDFDAPTVVFEPLYEHFVSHAFIWGMAKAEALKRAEPSLLTHNILCNVAPRPRNPTTPLAGTVFDPSRYRRP